MRRTDRELTSKEDLFDILQRADVCRIAFSAGSVPYVVPLCYGFEWVGSLVLYFHCAKEGRKIDLIRQNNHVCFEMDVDHELVVQPTHCHWGMKYKSVIGYGTLEIIESRGETMRALTRILEHYGNNTTPNYDPKIFDMTLALKLAVTEMSGKEKK